MVKTLPTVERSTKIRFGRHAREDQGENTIVLNASNTAVDASNGGAVYVSPVRFDDTFQGKPEIVLMMYNTTTKELTESGESAQDVIGNQGLQAVTNQGNVTSNSLIFHNNTVAFVTSGNVGISNSLASHTLSVGSNLYVDDYGTNVLVVSGGVGITDTTTSTSATTGALQVAGGISTQENLNVGAVAKVLSATDASSKTTGALIVTGGVGISKNIHALNANFEDVEADSVNITDTTQSNNQTTGALKVAGGLGVAGNVHCGNLTLTGNLTVTGNTTVINANNLIVQDPIIELGKGNASGLDTGIIMNNPLTGGNKGNVAMIYDFSTSKLEIGHTLKSATDTVIVMNTANTLPVNINGTLGVTGSTTSSSKTTGAVTIGGGLGVVGDIHATHVNFEDVEADSVTITDNTTSTSATTGALKVVGGISTQENLNVGAVAKIISATDASSKTTGALIVTGGVGISKNIHALHANFEDVEADSVTITDTTTSSSATTGALKVVGGISTQENLNVGAVAKVISATDASSKTTGALIVTGGLGVSKNIHGKNVFVEDVVSNSVVILDTTTSDSATTGALKVVGGISTQENLNVGAVAKVISGTDATSKTTGALIVTGGVGISKNIHALHANFEDVEADSVTITDNTTSSSATTGALKVVGGISTQENLNVGAVAKIISGTDASSKTTGALIVSGGVGISKNIHALNANFEDVEADSVNITDTTTSTSVTTGALKVAGGISTQEKLNVGGITKVWDDTTSSSITTGALQVVGGLGVGGAIFSSTATFDGNITVSGDLIVSGNTTSQGQNSLTVEDPTIEVGIGNVNGADLGIIMGNPLTGGHKGNVAIIYDFSASKLEIGHTLQSSADSTITMNTANTLAVNINGDLGVTGTTASDGKTAGALIIGGGVGISGALFGAAATLDGVVTLTDDTTSTSATTGALKVVGGISTQENLNVGAVAKVISGTDATSKTTGALIVTGGVGISKNIHALHANFEDVEADSVTVTDTTTSTSATTGALKVAGGISTQENLNVGAVAKVISATDASSKTTGALIVTGGVGISKNIHALHANFEDVEADSVTVTDTTTSTSATTGALKVAGGISTQENLNVGAVAKVISGTDASSKTTGALIVTGGVGISKNIHALHANFEDVEADSVTVTDTTTSDSATTGALKVAGGISTQENLNVGGDLKVDTSVLVVNSTTNRVGVNKASPAYALDVVGDINFTGTFREDGNPFISTPWTIETSPDALSYTAGNVGIGAADPEANLHVTGNTFISSTTDATTTVTGALIVAGGMGIAKKIVGQHANFEDVEADSVTVTDSTTSTSATTGALKVTGGISTQENLHIGGVSKVHGTTASDGKTAGALIVAGGVGVSGALFGAAATLDGVVTLTNATESTSSTTGALKAAGGVGIAKDVFVGERAYVTGGLITNTGGVGKKTYSFSTNLTSDASVANATYVLTFTNHPFHAKVTAMLIESDDEISTMIFDIIGGKRTGGSTSAYRPAIGQQTIIGTSSMNTPWSTIATTDASTGSSPTVEIKPANACSGVVIFNIFVEYLSHETAGRLTSINCSGNSPDSGDLGY